MVRQSSNKPSLLQASAAAAGNRHIRLGNHHLANNSALAKSRDPPMNIRVCNNGPTAACSTAKSPMSCLTYQTGTIPYGLDESEFVDDNDENNQNVPMMMMTERDDANSIMKNSTTTPSKQQHDSNAREQPDASTSTSHDHHDENDARLANTASTGSLKSQPPPPFKSTVQPRVARSKAYNRLASDAATREPPVPNKHFNINSGLAFSAPSPVTLDRIVVQSSQEHTTPSVSVVSKSKSSKDDEIEHTLSESMTQKQQQQQQAVIKDTKTKKIAFDKVRRLLHRMKPPIKSHNHKTKTIHPNHNHETTSNVSSDASSGNHSQRSKKLSAKKLWKASRSNKAHHNNNKANKASNVTSEEEEQQLNMTASLLLEAAESFSGGKEVDEEVLTDILNRSVVHNDNGTEVVSPSLHSSISQWMNKSQQQNHNRNRDDAVTVTSNPTLTPSEQQVTSAFYQTLLARAMKLKNDKDLTTSKLSKLHRSSASVSNTTIIMDDNRDVTAAAATQDTSAAPIVPDTKTVPQDIDTTQKNAGEPSTVQTKVWEKLWEKWDPLQKVGQDPPSRADNDDDEGKNDPPIHVTSPVTSEVVVMQSPRGRTTERDRLLAPSVESEDTILLVASTLESLERMKTSSATSPTRARSHSPLRSPKVVTSTRSPAVKMEGKPVRKLGTVPSHLDLPMTPIEVEDSVTMTQRLQDHGFMVKQQNNDYPEVILVEPPKKENKTDLPPLTLREKLQMKAGQKAEKHTKSLRQKDDESSSRSGNFPIREIDAWNKKETVSDLDQSMRNGPKANDAPVSEIKDDKAAGTKDVNHEYGFQFHNDLATDNEGDAALADSITEWSIHEVESEDTGAVAVEVMLSACNQTKLGQMFFKNIGNPLAKKKNKNQEETVLKRINKEGQMVLIKKPKKPKDLSSAGDSKSRKMVEETPRTSNLGYGQFSRADEDNIQKKAKKKATDAPSVHPIEPANSFARQNSSNTANECDIEIDLDDKNGARVPLSALSHALNVELNETGIEDENGSFSSDVEKFDRFVSSGVNIDNVLSLLKPSDDESEGVNDGGTKDIPRSENNVINLVDATEEDASITNGKRLLLEVKRLVMSSHITEAEKKDLLETFVKFGQERLALSPTAREELVRGLSNISEDLIPDLIDLTGFGDSFGGDKKLPTSPKDSEAVSEKKLPPPPASSHPNIPKQPAKSQDSLETLMDLAAQLLRMKGEHYASGSEADTEKQPMSTGELVVVQGTEVQQWKSNDEKDDKAMLQLEGKTQQLVAQEPKLLANAAISMVLDQAMQQAGGDVLDTICEATERFTCGQLGFHHKPTLSTLDNQKLIENIQKEIAGLPDDDIDAEKQNVAPGESEDLKMEHPELNQVPSSSSQKVEEAGAVLSAKVPDTSIFEDDSEYLKKIDAIIASNNALISHHGKDSMSFSENDNDATKDTSFGGASAVSVSNKEVIHTEKFGEASIASNKEALYETQEEKEDGVSNTDIVDAETHLRNDMGSKSGKIVHEQAPSSCTSKSVVVGNAIGSEGNQCNDQRNVSNTQQQDSATKSKRNARKPPVPGDMNFMNIVKSAAKTSRSKPQPETPTNFARTPKSEKNVAKGNPYSERPTPEGKLSDIAIKNDASLEVTKTDTEVFASIMRDARKEKGGLEPDAPKCGLDDPRNITVAFDSSKSQSEGSRMTQSMIGTSASAVDSSGGIEEALPTAEDKDETQELSVTDEQDKLSKQESIGESNLSDIMFLGNDPDGTRGSNLGGLSSFAESMATGSEASIPMTASSLSTQRGVGLSLDKASTTIEVAPSGDGFEAHYHDSRFDRDESIQISAGFESIGVLSQDQLSGKSENFINLSNSSQKELRVLQTVETGTTGPYDGKVGSIARPGMTGSMGGSRAPTLLGRKSSSEYLSESKSQDPVVTQHDSSSLHSHLEITKGISGIDGSKISRQQSNQAAEHDTKTENSELKSSQIKRNGSMGLPQDPMMVVRHASTEYSEHQGEPSSTNDIRAEHPQYRQQQQVERNSSMDVYQEGRPATSNSFVSEHSHRQLVESIDTIGLEVASAASNVMRSVNSHLQQQQLKRNGSMGLPQEDPTMILRHASTDYSDGQDVSTGNNDPQAGRSATSNSFVSEHSHQQQVESIDTIGQEVASAASNAMGSVNSHLRQHQVKRNGSMGLPQGDPTMILRHASTDYSDGQDVSTGNNNTQSENSQQQQLEATQSMIGSKQGSEEPSFATQDNFTEFSDQQVDSRKSAAQEPSKETSPSYCSKEQIESTGNISVPEDSPMTIHGGVYSVHSSQQQLEQQGSVARSGIDDSMPSFALQQSESAISDVVQRVYSRRAQGLGLSHLAPVEQKHATVVKEAAEQLSSTQKQIVDEAASNNQVSSFDNATPPDQEGSIAHDQSMQLQHATLLQASSGGTGLDASTISTEITQSIISTKQLGPPILPSATSVSQVHGVYSYDFRKNSMLESKDTMQNSMLESKDTYDFKKNSMLESKDTFDFKRNSMLESKDTDPESLRRNSLLTSKSEAMGSTVLNIPSDVDEDCEDQIEAFQSGPDDLNSFGQNQEQRTFPLEVSDADFTQPKEIIFCDQSLQSDTENDDVPPNSQRSVISCPDVQVGLDVPSLDAIEYTSAPTEVFGDRGFGDQSTWASDESSVADDRVVGPAPSAGEETSLPMPGSRSISSSDVPAVVARLHSRRSKEQNTSTDDPSPESHDETQDLAEETPVNKSHDAEERESEHLQSESIEHPQAQEEFITMENSAHDKRTDNSLELQAKSTDEVSANAVNTEIFTMTEWLDLENEGMEVFLKIDEDEESETESLSENDSEHEGVRVIEESDYDFAMNEAAAIVPNRVSQEGYEQSQSVQALLSTYVPEKAAVAQKDETRRIDAPSRNACHLSNGAFCAAPSIRGQTLNGPGSSDSSQLVLKQPMSKNEDLAVQGQNSKFQAFCSTATGGCMAPNMNSLGYDRPKAILARPEDDTEIFKELPERPQGDTTKNELGVLTREQELELLKEMRLKTVISETSISPNASIDSWKPLEAIDAPEDFEVPTPEVSNIPLGPEDVVDEDESVATGPDEMDQPDPLEMWSIPESNSQMSSNGADNALDDSEEVQPDSDPVAERSAPVFSTSISAVLDRAQEELTKDSNDNENMAKEAALFQPLSIASGDCGSTLPTHRDDPYILSSDHTVNVNDISDEKDGMHMHDSTEEVILAAPPQSVLSDDVEHDDTAIQASQSESSDDSRGLLLAITRSEHDENGGNQVQSGSEADYNGGSENESTSDSISSQDDGLHALQPHGEGMSFDTGKFQQPATRSADILKSMKDIDADPKNPATTTQRIETSTEDLMKSFKEIEEKHEQIQTPGKNKEPQGVSRATPEEYLSTIQEGEVNSQSSPEGRNSRQEDIPVQGSDTNSSSDNDSDAMDHHAMAIAASDQPTRMSTKELLKLYTASGSIDSYKGDNSHTSAHEERNVQPIQSDEAPLLTDETQPVRSIASVSEAQSKSFGAYTNGPPTRGLSSSKSGSEDNPVILMPKIKQPPANQEKDDRPISEAEPSLEAIGTEDSPIILPISSEKVQVETVMEEQSTTSKDSDLPDEVSSLTKTLVHSQNHSMSHASGSLVRGGAEEEPIRLNDPNTGNIGDSKLPPAENPAATVLASHPGDASYASGATSAHNKSTEEILNEANILNLASSTTGDNSNSRDFVSQIIQDEEIQRFASTAGEDSPDEDTSSQDVLSLCYSQNDDDSNDGGGYEQKPTSYPASPQVASFMAHTASGGFHADDASSASGIIHINSDDSVPGSQAASYGNHSFHEHTIHDIHNPEDISPSASTSNNTNDEESDSGDFLVCDSDASSGDDLAISELISQFDDVTLTNENGRLQVAVMSDNASIQSNSDFFKALKDIRRQRSMGSARHENESNFDESVARTASLPVAIEDILSNGHDFISGSYNISKTASQRLLQGSSSEDASASAGSSANFRTATSTGSSTTYSRRRLPAQRYDSMASENRSVDTSEGGVIEISESSSASVATHASQKARELRAQLDQAMKTSAAIRNTQERLGAELFTFKQRLDKQRHASASPTSASIGNSTNTSAYSPRGRSAGGYTTTSSEGSSALFSSTNSGYAYAPTTHVPVQQRGVSESPRRLRQFSEATAQRVAESKERSMSTGRASRSEARSPAHSSFATTGDYGSSTRTNVHSPSSYSGRYTHSSSETGGDIVLQTIKQQEMEERRRREQLQSFARQTYNRMEDDSIVDLTRVQAAEDDYSPRKRKAQGLFF